MSKYSFFLFSFLVASAVGWPRHDDMEQSQTSMSSFWRGATEKNSENIPFCKSAISTAASTYLSTYVQVCRDDSYQVGFCYFSTLFKCCRSSITDGIMVNSINEVHFGNVSVSTSILKAEQGGVCVTFLDKNAKIKICGNSQKCFPIRECLTPKRVCQINTVEGTTCTFDGCICKPGYADPDCCKCDSEKDFFKAQDGSCKNICRRQCLSPTLNDGCTECRPRYDEPTCCDCKPGFMKNNVGECVCPPGTVDVDGNCNTVCINNKLECPLGRSCACKPGYVRPDCCTCTFTDNESYFKRNGQCNEICTKHANKENCDGINGCSRCEDGFKLPDCCKCKEPKKLVGDMCKDCDQDEEKIMGICKEVCQGNIQKCKGDMCTCKPGYEPNDCCCPTGQKRDHNGMCICKVTEELPVNGVCPVPCIDHQDIIFLLDTSFGNDYSSLWRAGFFLEILVANLLQNTVDLNILITPLVKKEDQQKIENLVPEFAHPFDRSQCLRVALSIEDTIYINLSPDTYSDLTLLLLNDLLVDKIRPTTIITLAGSPSNTANGNIDNIIENIHQSRSRIASGRALPVKYFAVNFVNKENVLKENYRKELIALAGNNEDRYVTGSTWMYVFTNLLHTEGILCNERKNSIISYLKNTDMFNKYLRCLRKKRRDSSHKCVEFEEFSAFCTKLSKASIESKLFDALQELLGRLN